MALTLVIHRRLGTFKRVAQFIAPSTFLKQKFTEADFPAEKIQLLPNAFKAQQNESVGTEPRFVYVGRISAEKGVTVLLDACRINRDLQVDFIGDGPLLKELQQRAVSAGLNNVQFHGQLSHAEAMTQIHAATAVVLPSQCYENLPQAILEAWSFGVPAIATDLGGMRELIEEGKTGWLFPMGDAGALARIMAQALNQPADRAQMAEACRRQITSKFSQKRIGQELVQMYENVKRSF